MEEEEKEGRDYVGHFVRIIILGWSLSVMTLGYMERIRLDTFAAGLGKNGNQKKPVIVDNKNNKVGIK